MKQNPEDLAAIRRKALKSVDNDMPARERLAAVLTALSGHIHEPNARAAISI
jgi:hypothetical protein